MRWRTVLALGAGTALIAAACGGASGSTAAAVIDDLASTDRQTTSTSVQPAESPSTSPTADAESDDDSTLPSPIFEFAGVKAIDDPFHESFADPLIDLGLVIGGGPPPDGITPIDNPNFFGVERAGFLQPTEPILVIEFNGEVRGFPIQIMTWHEIVNTSMGGVPISVTFCPLCNSATAFPRQLSDGRTIDFGTSGLLFNSSLLMYDRQTGSLWTHFDGKAVVGALVGEELEKIPVQSVSWEIFKEKFPDALVLNRNTGMQRSYGLNPYAGYDSTTTSPFAFVGDTDDRLLAKTRVVAVRGTETLVLVTGELAEVSVANEVLDGEPVVVFHRAGTSSALDSQFIFEGKDIGATGVFAAQANGQALSFEPGPDGLFTDAETGSSWDIFGEAIAGPLTGTTLEPLEHLDTFWFAIAAFAPDARIVALG